MGRREGDIGEENHLAGEDGGRGEVEYVEGRVEIGPTFSERREMRGSGLKIQT